MDNDFGGRLAFAHRLADAAGAVILPYFRQRIDVTDKNASTPGQFDPVTAADRGAEERIRALIEGAYPEDAILGEEYGERAGTSGYRWVLDPVDGTRAFVAGQPMWGTLIALEENGRRVMGLLDQPFLKERFTGASGRTEFLSARGIETLRVSACASLADAVINTTHPMAHFGPEERVQFFAVEGKTRLSRYGGDCYSYALLAMGFIDLVMEARLQPWDTAALIPIIEGAGGVVSDWQGRPLTGGGDILAAGDARVHAEALAVIAASRA
jgi:myo-inositol-1(or 4)-monophosphatase